MWRWPAKRHCSAKSWKAPMASRASGRSSKSDSRSGRDSNSVPPTDRFVATAQFYVRYAETDAQGVVHHASYIVWLEEARLNYARARGRDYADIERAGIFMAVTGVEVRYRAAAHFGDYITVHCWLDQVKSRTMAF